MLGKPKTSNIAGVSWAETPTVHLGWFKLTQILNIVTGKDKNWDGSVDIKDKLIEAEEETKNGKK